MAVVFLILGIGCLLYFIALVLSAGLAVSFGGIWVLLGAVFLAVYEVFKRPSLKGWVLGLPKVLRAGVSLLALAGVLLFLGAQILIISGMTGKPEPGLDAVIVLGAQVRGTRVSRALAQRLNRAADYLRENPKTYVIVSGGQGPGEDITEAQAMSRYLQDLGIGEERILMEDRSVNTAQNLRYSFEMLKDNGDTVGLVSNGFHVVRATRIARAQGKEVQGIPAVTDWWMLPHYMMREAFALGKDFLVGNAR